MRSTRGRQSTGRRAARGWQQGGFSCRAARGWQQGGFTCRAARGWLQGGFTCRATRGWLQGGFTYVAMLIGVAIIGLGLAATGQVWSQSSQREKEQELLFVGNQFRQAIERYTRESPGGASRYPAKLEDLLQDSRSVTVKRYLRRIYRDPMTGKTDWGLLIAPGGGIMGVHSLSDKAPLKTGNFRKADERFRNAQRYSDWLFLHEGAALPDAAAGVPLSAPNPAR